MYLTKSDFKVSCDCRTRLYYRKSGYPTAIDENEYLQFLADGGFMVEFIAKARYPEGVDLADIRNAVDVSTRTSELLSSGDVTIFEAGLIHGNFHVRTDILRKLGPVLELIEVKSSSIEDDEDDAVSPFLTKKGAVTSRWRKYFLDLAFQTYVARLAFPAYTVKPILCVVNKSKVVADHETIGHFHLTKDRADPKARPAIVYRGDLAALRDTGLLAFRSVDMEVSTLMTEVVERANTLAGLIGSNGVARVAEPLSEFYGKCRKCDFRIAGERSGFAECWGDLGRVRPHVLDLFRVTQIVSKDEVDPVAELLRQNRASLLDLTEEQLGTNSYAVRRRMQWRCLRDGSAEHLPAALREELLSHQQGPGWPLHFIDFEACDIALPHHAGLHPFERVAFQWSCHTVERDGTVRHREWLNDRPDFPNFGFAESLRNCIGDEGTVYVWSWYEQTTLRKILDQIHLWLAVDEGLTVRLSGLRDATAVVALADWIDRLLGPTDAKGKRHNSPRIRDLHKAAAIHYFSPRMGGRTSIKVVLPAIWELDARLRANPCFSRYVVTSGSAADPYESLPALPFGEEDEEEDAVREGTGAVRVYQDLIFSDSASAQDKQNRRQLLLQYCQLDTAAMVMIWAHWLGRYDLVPI
jgi:hypothetical protein